MHESKRRAPRAATSLLAVALLAAATIALGAATRRPAAEHAPPPAATAGTGGPVSLSARVDRGAVLADGDGNVRVEIALAAAASDGGSAPRQPTDLLIVLDRSGSMNGAKLDDARAAVHRLVEKLGPQDRLALVTFSSGARLEIPLQYASETVRPAWSRTIDAVYAGGGTFLAAGMRLGLDALEAGRAAGRVPRAIVLSDGLAAEAPEMIRDQARRAVTGEYTLSAVGVGRDFDEELMSSLADVGTGNYYYLDEVGGLQDVFAREFETARETLASAVSVTLEPGPGVRVVEAAGYPLERGDATVVFRPGTLFAGQERRIWVTYRVPVEPGATSDLGGVRVAYAHAGERRSLGVASVAQVAAVADEKRFLARLDEAAWADGAVVEGYGAMRRDVARAIRAGDRDAARDVVRRYREQAASLNAAVASPAVAAQIDSAGALEAEVDEAFRGADAPEKRNRLGKKLHAEANRDRRVGSRK
jgi:Ca-activated chloride channel family protein